MNRDESFEKMYDQIDADKESNDGDRRTGMKKSNSQKSFDGSESDRRSGMKKSNSQKSFSQGSRRGFERGGGGERGRRSGSQERKGSIRSKSKNRHRSRSRARRSENDDRPHKKALSPGDLFAEDDGPASPKKEVAERSSSRPRPRMTKTLSNHELQSKSSITLEDDDDNSTGSMGKDEKMDGKTSAEKIEQLEVKNALYREEFKRAQREKKQLKKQKDAEIEELQDEIAELRKEVRASDTENRQLKSTLAEGAGSAHRLKTLEEENTRLQAELKETVDRASTMVKERDTAIEDLLAELEKAKEAGVQDRTMFDATLYKNKVKMEKLDQLNDEYAQKIQILEEQLSGKKGKK